MKRISILLVSLVITFSVYAQVKVACIGNSITFGHGLKNEEKYPTQLAGFLGSGWEVQNFGVSGSTLLRNGDRPYVREKAYADAKAFLPDVVIIKLGTNDSKPQNWKMKDEFESDYTSLINEIKALPSRPFVMICLPVPAYGVNFRINDTIVNNEVTAKVRKIAKDNDVKLIDLFTPLSNHPEWFPDKIHPIGPGATEIAKVVSKNILKYKKKIRNKKVRGKRYE
jgi:lysophospholipase L1-like esterase